VVEVEEVDGTAVVVVKRKPSKLKIVKSSWLCDNIYIYIYIYIYIVYVFFFFFCALSSVLC